MTRITKETTIGEIVANGDEVFAIEFLWEKYKARTKRDGERNREMLATIRAAKKVDGIRTVKLLLENITEEA